MQYIKYIAIGVILFFILRIIPRISKRLIKRKINKDRFSAGYPIVEFSIWSAFLLWTIRELFKDKFYFTTLISGIIIVILIFTGYYVVRDFIAGLLLKTEYNLRKNSNIKIENIKGKILKLNYLSLEIKSSEHEKIKIPYSKISGKEIIILNSIESVNKFSYNVEIPKKNKNIIDEKNRLKNKILNLPWSSVTEIPDIKLITETEKSWNFTIYFFAQCENHAERIKQALIEN